MKTCLFHKRLSFRGTNLNNFNNNNNLNKKLLFAHFILREVLNNLIYKALYMYHCKILFTTTHAPKNCFRLGLKRAAISFIIVLILFVAYSVQRLLKTVVLNHLAFCNCQELVTTVFYLYMLSANLNLNIFSLLLDSFSLLIIIKMR